MKIVITIEWWRTNTENKEILEHHKTALEETAMEKIVPMMQESFICGELNDNIFMHDDDIENSNEGIEYRGHWEVKEIS